MAFRFRCILALSFPLCSLHAEEYVLARNEAPPVGTTIDCSYWQVGKMDLQYKDQGIPVSVQGGSSTGMDGRFAVISPSKFTFVIKNLQMTFTGVRDDGDEHDFLHGSPVVIEKKDGVWTRRKEDGSALSEEEEAEFTDFDPLEVQAQAWLIYGDTPRKPGDRWTVDLSKTDHFGALKHPTGTISAEFVDVTKVTGIDCATIKLNIDLKAETGARGDITLKCEATEHRSLADRLALDMTSIETKEFHGKDGVAMTGSTANRVTVSYIIHHP